MGSRRRNEVHQCACLSQLNQANLQGSQRPGPVEEEERSSGATAST